MDTLAAWRIESSLEMRKSKKGFTLVELVIVIAVIAILAAVLIPTFSGIISKANKSSALQAIRNEITEMKIALAVNGMDIEPNAVFEKNGYRFVYKDGELTDAAGACGHFFRL